MSKELKKPTVYEYTNYRQFLKDMYAYLKSTQPSFSYRYFSLKGGFRSPNFYKLIAEGVRNLSRDSTAKFAKVLKLNSKETEFFSALVALNQSSSIEEEQEHAHNILKFRSFQNIHPLSREQYEYLAKWFIIPVREILALDHLSHDSKSLAEAFVSDIYPKQVEEALELLTRLKLIGRKSNGRWQQNQALLSTGDAVFGTAVRTFHHEMMSRAQEALHSDPTKFDISSVTIAISEKNYAKLKGRIQKFRKELLAIAESDTTPDVVYQLNLQLFPISKSHNKQGK